MFRIGLMGGGVQDLLAAFQRDHAALGRGLHDLAASLRGSNILSAKKIASELDQNAGPHIAFKEMHFYPRLRGPLNEQEVGHLYGELRTGQAVLLRILAMPDAAWPDRKETARLLRNVESMERHLAECTRLFSSMAHIPATDQIALLGELSALARSAPRWTELPLSGQSLE